MQVEAKVRVKRKLEKGEPNTIKSKAPLKAELVIKLNELQNRFDTLEATNNDLEATNKQNLEKYSFCKKELKHLKKKYGPKLKVVLDSSVLTVILKPRMK